MSPCSRSAPICGCLWLFHVSLLLFDWPSNKKCGLISTVTSDGGFLGIGPAPLNNLSILMGHQECALMFLKLFQMPLFITKHLSRNLPLHAWIILKNTWGLHIYISIFSPEIREVPCWSSEPGVKSSNLWGVSWTKWSPSTFRWPLR